MGEWLARGNNGTPAKVGGLSRHATFSLLITLLIQTEVASENDWHLQWKKDFTDTNYILKDVSTFCHPKGGAQMCRKAKFVGSSLVVGKTDATHF